MTTDAYGRAAAAACFLLERTHSRPKIGLVLGSGLGAFADRLLDSVSVRFTEIPDFPQATVAGHNGRLVIGTVPGAGFGVPVVVMQGRVHGYEGYSPEEVTFPLRVLWRMGVRTLVLTNAAGGIRPDFHQGQLVLLSDHINFTGRNPLVGKNDERFGPRFFDMTETYSRRLRELAQKAAAEAGLTMPEGVYLGLSGPSYETPAEIRAFRTLGADLVGMSTVHEAIVARHMGIDVLGISCVTNMAAGLTPGGAGVEGTAPVLPINHAEVMETGLRVQAEFARLLTGLLPLLAAESAPTYGNATGPR